MLARGALKTVQKYLQPYTKIRLLTDNKIKLTQIEIQKYTTTSKHK